MMGGTRGRRKAYVSQHTRSCMLRILLFLLLPLGLSAQAFPVFGPDRTPVLYLPPSADSLVRWAARDFADGLTALSGRTVSVVERERRDLSVPGIYVSTGGDAQLAGKWETFSLQAKDGSLIITGSDVRGTVRGISPGK